MGDFGLVSYLVEKAIRLDFIVSIVQNIVQSERSHNFEKH